MGKKKVKAEEKQTRKQTNDEVKKRNDKDNTKQTCIYMKFLYKIQKM